MYRMYTRIRKLFVDDVVLGCKTCCFIKVIGNCEWIMIRSMEVGGAQHRLKERLELKNSEGGETIVLQLFKRH